MRKALVLLLAALLVVAASVPLLAQDSGNTAYIRVAHLSPAISSAVVFVDGEALFSGLRYQSVTRWREVEPGSYEIAAGSGGDVENAEIGPVTVEIEAGDYLTIAAYGNENLGAALIEEDITTIAEGDARVTVFHAIEGAPAVDVLANGSPVVTLLGFPGTIANPDGLNDGLAVLDVPAGTYDFQVVANGTTTAILDLPGTELEAGTSYIVAAVGSPESPDVVVATATVEEAAADQVDPFADDTDATEEMDMDATEEADMMATEEMDMDATEEPEMMATEEMDMDATEEADMMATEEMDMDATEEPEMMATEEMDMDATEEADMMATEEMDMDATEEPEMMATEEGDEGEETAAGGTITEIAMGNDDFSTLVAAVMASPEVLETLTNGRTYTVFAPTNEAFEATLEEAGLTLEDVTGDPELLQSILEYHIIRGSLPSTALRDGGSIVTLGGERITISIDGDTVMVNDSATVVTADIEASDGIIHVIDMVLLPPMDEEEAAN